MAEAASTSTATREDQTAAACTILSVKGMNCQGCVRNTSDAILKVPGVAGATVELEPGRALVRWQPGVSPDPGAVIAAVTGAGYQAALALEAAAAPTPERQSPLAGWRLNVVLGVLATVPLMAGEWLLDLGMARWFQWAGLILALPVQVLCGARFYRGAWNQLKAGKSNMDTLVALGSTTAFCYSLWALLSSGHRHVYFMEAAAIITLISVGHWLESLASARAASALRALLDLAPATARRLAEGGAEAEVPVASLREGDRVLLKPGDLVPTDGVVHEGQSAVDEAMLTGESAPVEKGPDARLYAGTVNQDGRLVMRVTGTGQATALAHIIALVQRAQTSRAEIQKLGDRVSSIFVPVVVLVAVAAACWWGFAFVQARGTAEWLSAFLWPVTLPSEALAVAAIHAAAVLIVACPCAMGLATPAAIMAGANAAARRGILIRDALAIEKTGRLTAVVFDKTGTLTEGRPAVAAVEDVRPPAERAVRLEAVAAALAGPSNHPSSRAVAGLEPAGAAIPFEAWQEVRGCGVQAQGGAGLWRLGSLKWLAECGVGIEPGEAFQKEWTARAATLLGLALDARLVGLLALRDGLKPHAREVVRRLLEQGKAVYLLTGDSAQTARAIAREAGIGEGNVFAEVRPGKKAEILGQLQRDGQRVAFVGDGINDAPALAQADLGMAVSRASDVAREAADLILLRSDIEAIPEALGLAQATLRTIKQNLFWAFFYNAAAVPLAALGFMSPVLCAAAMGVSDLVVIGNALRLRRWAP